MVAARYKMEVTDIWTYGARDWYTAEEELLIETVIEKLAGNSLESLSLKTYLENILHRWFVSNLFYWS